MSEKSPNIYQLLSAPFAPEDIEWRVQASGEKNDGTIWARVVPYITSRAVMDRLDEAVGAENWQESFRPISLANEDGMICRLQVDYDGRPVTHEDVAPATNIEALKGAFSDALKRVAVKFGIGRYLYHLEAGWATIRQGGRYRNKTKSGKKFEWDPPGLPAWALPGGSGKPAAPARAGQIPPGAPGQRPPPSAMPPPHGPVGPPGAQAPPPEMWSPSPFGPDGPPPPQGGGPKGPQDPAWAGSLPQNSGELYEGQGRRPGSEKKRPGDDLADRVVALLKQNNPQAAWSAIGDESQQVRRQFDDRLYKISPKQMAKLYAVTNEAGVEVELMKKYVYRFTGIDRHKEHDGDHLELVPSSVFSAVLAAVEGGGCVRVESTSEK